MKTIVFACLLFYMGSCNTGDNSTTTEIIVQETQDEASIVSISTSGNEEAYTFSVGIASPDTGCEQYANWWEVISEDGSLIYRRILAHSHVNEQPFIRSGGAVNIASTQVVLIRVHMNTSGYSTKGYKGSITNGFSEYTISENFAEALQDQEPQPNGCAF